MSTHLPALAHDKHVFAWPKEAGAQGSLTYEPFFGLREKPFSLSADPRFLFRSPSHAPAFDQLLAGIRRREGLIVLSGEIGTGKTTLCRAVLNSLDRRTFCTFVPDPFVSREDLLKMLLVDFGVMSVDDLKSGRLRNASRPELSYPLYEFLNSLVPLQAFAVLIIDEAQNLPLPLLEEIRILSDLEGREKLLQVVLVGQPELRASLEMPQMRQVDQRVSVRCELAPLKHDEIAGYVGCRLDVAAGGSCETVQFTSAAFQAVYAASGGTPRLINLICDRALYETYSKGANIVDEDTIAVAIDRLGLPRTVAEPAVEGEPVNVAPPVAPAPIPMPAPEAAEAAETLEEFRSEAQLPNAVPPQSNHVDLRRRLAVLAMTGLALCGATAAASSWYRLDAKQAVARQDQLPALPPRPPLVGALALLPIPASAAAALSEAANDSGNTNAFIIQVASFEDDGRSSRLVADLAAAGFRAFKSPFQLEGERWWQVSVGPYATSDEANAALRKIREIPGYDDATLRSPARP